LAEKGDRIILAVTSQPYRESISLFGANNSGHCAERPFIIEANGAVLEGSDPLPSTIWQHYQDDIYRFRPMRQPINMTYGMMFLEGQPLRKVQTLSELQPLDWATFQGWVYFRAEPGKSPQFLEHYNLSYSSRQSGVTLLHVRHVRIHDLTVQGFQTDGISAFNSARDIVLDTVEATANGRAGLSVGGASTLMAGYSRFLHNGHTAVLAMPFSNTLLFGCETGDNIDNRGANVEIQDAPHGPDARPVMDPILNLSSF